MIWSSPGRNDLVEPVSALPPHVPEPLDRILAVARCTPERTFLVDAATGMRVSFGALVARIDRVAAGLAGLGLALGTR